MTDTHWNNRGAFVAYAGFSRKFGLPAPEVGFQQGSTYQGDLIKISGLKNFPLHAEDNWDVIWKKRKPIWTEQKTAGEHKTEFGESEVVTDDAALSNKYIWIVGDSFTIALRQYFNATFKKVRYIGHWAQKLNELPAELDNAAIKPDMIVIIKVERSF